MQIPSPIARYSKKRFTQIYRDLNGEAMLVLTRISTNMADGNPMKARSGQNCVINFSLLMN